MYSFAGIFSSKVCAMSPISKYTTLRIHIFRLIQLVAKEIRCVRAPTYMEVWEACCERDITIQPKHLIDGASSSLEYVLPSTIVFRLVTQAMGLSTSGTFVEPFPCPCTRRSHLSLDVYLAFIHGLFHGKHDHDVIDILPTRTYGESAPRADIH